MPTISVSGASLSVLRQYCSWKSKLWSCASLAVDTRMYGTARIVFIVFSPFFIVGLNVFKFFAPAPRGRSKSTRVFAISPALKRENIEN